MGIFLPRAERGALAKSAVFPAVLPAGELLALAGPSLILTGLKGNVSAMSYKTVEVELENGRVHPAGAETLPDKAHALLTILSPQAVKSEAPAKSLGQAMRALGVMGRGEFTDLSTNPRHLDDFGK